MEKILRLHIDHESWIEQALVREVKKRGGLALKFVSPGRVGVPDRIVLIPGGRCVFAEIKAPGKKLRKLQIAAHRVIHGFGLEVSVVSSLEEVKTFCERYFGQGVRTASVSAVRD